MFQAEVMAINYNVILILSAILLLGLTFMSSVIVKPIFWLNLMADLLVAVTSQIIVLAGEIVRADLC